MTSSQDNSNSLGGPQESSDFSTLVSSHLFEYLSSAKGIPEKIPKEILEDPLHNKFSDVLKLFPSEDTCHRCNGGLASEEAGKRSKIVYMTKIIQG
jgi:hypothetical protein